MSSPAISDQATKNNQRLFKRYAHIFQNPDVAPFIGHAEKFSLWLSDHKAYYVSARPEIIRLLLVAQGTLRRALHIPEDLSVPFNVHDYPPHPLMPPYILLVHSILPFENMFSEPSLIAHIRTLRGTITPRYPNISGPSGPYPQSSLTASLSPSGNITGSALRMTSAATTFDPDVQLIEHQTQLHPAVPFSDPDIQVIEKPHRPLRIMTDLPFSDPDIQIIENPNLSATSISQGPLHNSNNQSASTTAPLRRVKKRRTLNLEALAQTDVQSLLPKKQTSTQPSKDTITVPATSTSNSSPATPSNLHQTSAEPPATPSVTPIEASEMQSIDAKPIIPKRFSTAVKDVSSHGSRPLDMPVASDSGFGSAFPPFPETPVDAQVFEISVKKERPTSPEIPMDVDNPRVIGFYGTDVTEGSKQLVHADSLPPVEVKHGSSQTEGAMVEAQEVQTSPQIVAVVDNSSTIEASKSEEASSARNYPTQISEEQQIEELIVPQFQVENSSDALPATEMVLVSSPMQVSTPEPANQQPPPFQNVTVEMNMTFSAAENQSMNPLPPVIKSNTQTDKGLSDSTNQPAALPIETIPSPSQILPVSAVPMVLVLPVENAPLHHTSSALSDQPMPETPSNKGVFTSEMRVAAFQKGMKEQRRIHFQFDIPEPQFDLVLVWLGRSKSKSAQEIQTSICLSLGCYLTSDLDELSEKEGCDTIEQQASLAHSVWPSGGNLIMNVQLDGTRQDLPLAPPLQATPDNLVDISGFLTMGKNRIELSQYEDLSQYTFILHAHFPTPAQLHHWEEQHKKNKEWDDWIQHMSRPFNIGLSASRKPTSV